jgi:hypothetical protein
MKIMSILELMRHGQKLELTDQKYYAKRVKLEFINNKELEKDKIPYCIRQGKVFMLSNNVV